MISPTAALFLSFVTLVGQTPEENRPIVPASSVHVGAITATDVPLGHFIEQLSQNTHVAFCIENRGDSNRSTLGLLNVNLNVDPSEDLETVLTQLQRAYPIVQWTVEAGIVVLRSADIKDDPLDLRVKPFSFQGTVRDYVRYLNSHVPGVMANTMEISQMYDRNAVYSLNTESEVSLREALSVLTRNSGVRWNALVRDEGMSVQIPNGEGGKPVQTRTGRVTIFFTRGPLSQLVSK